MTTPNFGPVGRVLAASGWTPADPDHPARDLDRHAEAWASPDGTLLMVVSGPRPQGHLIGLYAPRTTGDIEDTLWQINGGPVPAPVAVAMARAALLPNPGGPGAPLSTAGWTRAPSDALSEAIPGLAAWTGPSLDHDHDRSWSAVLFPMPTRALELWTVKGAYHGHDCTLIATADTPAHVIAAAASTTDLVQTLLDSGWIRATGSTAPEHALRPAAGAGLTLRVPAALDEPLVLEADRRHLSDGTIWPPWHAEVYWRLPAAMLAAIAAADADPCAAATEPGDLLAEAGWNRSPLRHREWSAPDSDRELLYFDSEGSGTWSIVRHDLAVSEDVAKATGDSIVAITASADTPANVIAAFALTDAL